LCLDVSSINIEWVIVCISVSVDTHFCILNIKAFFSDFKVHIGLPNDDEEIDADGNVVHTNQHGIRVSWSSRDPESDVVGFHVAIGTKQFPESVLRFTDFGQVTTAYIGHIFFDPSNENGNDIVFYIVSVKATNGANLVSDAGKSKQIFIQKANVPGIVFDGSELYEDAVLTFDHTSISASFYGFKSDACDIISYDWAIGSTEYGTDIMTYTNYGVVMNNHTHGQAQILTELYENLTYFVSVRAVTGCHQEYLVSSSDGITLDRTAPQVVFGISDYKTSVFVKESVIYQSEKDVLNVVANVSDLYGVSQAEWALGTVLDICDKYPFTHDLSDITAITSLTDGEAVFLTTRVTDKAGNTYIGSSHAFIADSTAPYIKELQCSPFLSVQKTRLTCTWTSVVEEESRIGFMRISIWTNNSNMQLIIDDEFNASQYSYSTDLYNLLKDKTSIKYLTVELTATNVVGQSTIYGREVVVDRTPPLRARLDVVTGTVPGIFADTHQHCQFPRDYVEVRLKDVDDAETGIDLKR